MRKRAGRLGRDDLCPLKGPRGRGTSSGTRVPPRGPNGPKVRQAMTSMALSGRSRVAVALVIGPSPCFWKPSFLCQPPCADWEAALKCAGRRKPADPHTTMAEHPPPNIQAHSSLFNRGSVCVLRLHRQIGSLAGCRYRSECPPPRWVR